MSRLRPPEFRPVLLVIDMQNGFCSQGGSYQQYGGKIGADINTYRKVIPNIKQLISICHEMRIPVFYTRQIRDASGIDLLSKVHNIIPERRAEFVTIPACVEGTWDAEIIDELKMDSGDYLIYKRRDSAFQDTELDLYLRSVGADTIIFTGVDTSICVENSIRDGFNIGYDVILVEDGVASSWKELHKATLMKVRGSFGLVLKTEQLLNILRTGRWRASAFRLAVDNF